MVCAIALPDKLVRFSAIVGRRKILRLYKLLVLVHGGGLCLYSRVSAASPGGRYYIRQVI
jgi:hypothetical protein